MSVTPTPTHPSQDRRRVPAVLLGMFIGLMICKAVEKALTPSLGEWGAFAIGALAAGAAAGITGVVFYRLISPQKGSA